MPFTLCFTSFRSNHFVIIFLLTVMSVDCSFVLSLKAFVVFLRRAASLLYGSSSAEVSVKDTGDWIDWWEYDHYWNGLGTCPEDKMMQNLFGVRVNIVVRGIFTLIHSLIITFPSERLQCILLFLFKALINHLWFGKSLKDAINTPVVYVDSENAVKFEPNFEKVRVNIQCI